MFSAVSPAGKWLGFVTAVWVQSISGNNYTFSNYSAALKSLMALTQLQLNNLSVAKDVGKAFGLLAGLASDRLPTPLILLIGSIEGLVGYGFQWLVVSQRIRPLPYWQMCIFLCMGGNSTTWMNTAILVTCMRNFRKNRGPVSGILKGYVGLSTAIFTDLCSALFADDPSSFLLMLAIIPAVVCFTAVLFLRETPPTIGAAAEKEETEYFNVINVIAVVIAVYLLVYDFTGENSGVVSLVFAIGLLFLLAAPLGIPMYAFWQSWVAGKASANSIAAGDVERQIQEPLLVQQVVPEQEQEQKPEIATTTAPPSGEVVESETRKRKPVIGEDHTIIEAVGTPDFWILFVSFLCGVGTGLAVMNNMGQMGLALGYADVSIFVSLTSIWGFFGRIISGTVSEHFMRKAGTPRPLWNAVSQILMAVGYVVMAIGLPGSLYIGSSVVGLCYGIRVAITVPIASNLFGLKYYVATLTPSGATTCIGAHCYRLVFVIMAIACIVGFGLDVLLSIRTKNVYSKIQGTKNSGSKKSNKA
ncbi:protein NUCLEAR FUSION DEFECTIVE 4-like [Macadamia integrifolia]|uniref:protein NUCLEAR FUSION DEFECTIVE 4-like n=1 Tax=Macadamia integrifolia TaxID=60698 RepID=UPI001C4F9955|nr:protein NUCLEAR FUSION DEFECTIVE 4-like [Macadamia integrifolia]